MDLRHTSEVIPMSIHTNILRAILSSDVRAYLDQGSTCHPDACMVRAMMVIRPWAPYGYIFNPSMVGMALFPSMATLSLP